MLAQDSIRTINMTTEYCALSLMIVLIVGTLPHVMHKKRRLLLVAMFLHALTVMGYLLKGVFEFRPGPLAHMAVLVGAYLSTLLAIVTCAVVSAYIYSNAAIEPLVDLRSDRFMHLLAIALVLNIALVLTNPLTHGSFMVNASNELVWGPASWVSDLLLFAQSAVAFPLVVHAHGMYDRTTTLRLLLCGLLATGAALFNMLQPALDTLPMAVSLLIMLLAVGVQTRLEEDLAQARAEVAESRVRLLSGQIHPHFIFNSLNAIKALVVEDPALAEQTIQDFSDYLRTHLDVMSSSRLVPFLQEMDHVRHYVSLEVADPVGPMEVAYDLQVTDFLIPPLTVQPLVENAIRHGVKTREGGGRVLLESHATDDAIVVSVTDDGKGISSVTLRQEERQRIGLDNVRERIERQCAGSLEVESKPTGTVARLILPRDGVS